MIELLLTNEEVVLCDGCLGFEKEKEAAAKMADYLLANGVTIPVRCKDCRYWDRAKNQWDITVRLPFGRCQNDRYAVLWQESKPITPEDHYCADGERREGNGT